MSNYNSENTKVLETYDDNGNLRMLLMHEMGCGRREYVIGSYFTVKWNPIDDVFNYSWDWGHYFCEEGALLRAVDYWKDEVLGEGSEHGIEG